MDKLNVAPCGAPVTYNGKYFTDDRFVIFLYLTHKHTRSDIESLNV